MGEMILNYNDFLTASSQLDAVGTDLHGQLPIWGCEAGDVEIGDYFVVINDNIREIEANLVTMAKVAREIVNEVDTVDQNGATHTAARIPWVQSVGTDYVSPGGVAGTPPAIPGLPGPPPVGPPVPPRLDLPPSLQPKGGK